MVIESFTEESWELILKDCGAILTGMSGYRRTELLNNSMLRKLYAVWQRWLHFHPKFRQNSAKVYLINPYNKSHLPVRETKT